MKQEAVKRLQSPVFEALSRSINKQFIYLCDSKTGIWRWSPRAVEYFGLPGEYVEDLPGFWMPRVHPEDLARVTSVMGGIFTGPSPEHSCEYRVLNAEGRYVWVLCRGCLLPRKEEQPELCAGVLTNLGSASKFDPVTGLRNAYTFLRDMDRLMESGAAQGGVLLIDIDHFRRMNATNEYSFGNALLAAYCAELQKFLPPGAVLYRMNGDQFAFVILQADRETVESIFRSAAQACEVLVEGRLVRFTITGGALFFPENGAQSQEIYQNLEHALETAKVGNRAGVSFFTHDAYEETLWRYRLQEKLSESVRDGCRGFSLNYQPLVSNGQKKLIGAEALLRWSDPSLPPVSPTEFVPLLEQNGDINIVGRWVLTTALRQVKKWQEKTPDLRVSVNVSYIQLADDSFIDFVLEEIDRFQYPRNQLILELTESCNVTDSKLVNDRLRIFRDCGIQIALDDFGTGYASLSILRDLSADWIKVDHTFVAQIANSDYDQALTEYLIKLCQKLGLHVCVEGIETEEIQNIIQEYRPTILQGYYYSRPVEPGIFEKQFLQR